MQEDAEHRQVNGSIKGFCITHDRNDFNLSTHISLRQHGPNQLFLQALRAAFDTDYNIRSIVAFRDRRLRWNGDLLLQTRKSGRLPVSMEPSSFVVFLLCVLEILMLLAVPRFEDLIL